MLHADHEQNCSANAMRSVGSSEADPYCATAAAAAALYGPLHGGANEAVLRMLNEIGSKDNVASFIKRVQDGEVRLMGFGHRVYKSYDPRATIIKKTAHEVFEVTGKNPLIDIAVELERIALQEDYFVKRRLYPNVDFYSGIIYEAMGFPVSMFPVLFAIPRTSGWIAQWEEMLTDDGAEDRPTAAVVSWRRRARLRAYGGDGRSVLFALRSCTSHTFEASPMLTDSASGSRHPAYGSRARLGSLAVDTDVASTPISLSYWSMCSAAVSIMRLRPALSFGCARMPNAAYRIPNADLMFFVGERAL